MLKKTTAKVVKLASLLRNKDFRSILKRYHVAATVEHLPLLHQIIDCYTVVDIGANRGQFALVARDVFPNAIIHSVEPLDEPAQIFTKVFQNDSKTFLHHCAIGEKKTTMKIHVARDDDSSSLLPIGKKQIELFPKTKEREIREVLVLPLHKLLDKKEIFSPALLKLDVQGFELSVLEGCQTLLDRFAYVYVECSFVELYEGQALAYEIIEFLNKKNFVLDGIYNTYYDDEGKAVQSDFFFVNQKCVSQSSD